MTTRLYINDTQVDLYDEGASIALSYEISDITDIDKRGSASSKTIKVPLTAANKVTLGFPDDISSSGALAQSTTHTARIEVDGVDIIKGLAKIVSTSTEPPRQECEIVVVGDNGDWKVKIADLKLADLDFSSQDHIFNRVQIATAWTTPANYDYNYPVMDFGGLVNKKEVLVDDVRPAVKVRSIFQKIIEGQGYRISSTFMGGTFFGNLFMVGGKYNDLPDSWRADRLFRVGLTGNLTPTTGYLKMDLNDVTSAGNFNSTNTNWSTSGYECTIDAASIQRFTANISWYSPPVANVGHYLYVRINQYRGGSIVNYTEGYQEGDNLTHILTVQTPNWKCLSGDKISVYVKYVAAPGVTLVAPTIYDAGTAFYNDVVLTLTEGNTVQLVNVVPDITQLEFIQAVKQLFNLYFWTNSDERTVYIEPRDDFYLDKSLASDWSSKLDRDSEIIFEYITPQNKTTHLKYKEDSKDYNASQFNKRFDPDFGAYRYTSTNKYAEEEGEIENKVFAPTWMEWRGQLGHEYRLPVITREGNKNVQEFECVPRILYYNGLVSCKEWKFGGVGLILYPHFTFTNFHTANDTSLNFADHDMAKGLYSKYYRNTMFAVDNAMMLKGTFYLQPTDLLNIDFRKPILVDGVYYTINAIRDYIPATGGLVDVELLKIANKTTYVAKTTDNQTATMPPEYDAYKPVEPNYVQVMMEDVRVRPSTIVPVMIEDEQGNIVPIYTEG